MNKKLNVNGKRINLSIWDTAGQERFHALGPIYYRSSDGAILVYDITDEDSFQRVKNWVRELKKMLGTEIMLTIVGNKTDLEEDRNVTQEEAETYAVSVGATHYETSAKVNEGIEELFLDLTSKMVEARDRKLAHSLSRTNSMRRNNALVIGADDESVVGEEGGSARSGSSSASSSSSRCCGTG